MKFLQYFSCWLFMLLVISPGKAQNTLFRSDKGVVHFRSDAPLELIEAASTKLRGALRESGQFAFAVRINSFEGFNSPLQREHFQENYLEANNYKLASFSGRIIEKIDLSQEGTYTIRAKGTLDIHGIKRERIIRSQLTVKGKEIHIAAAFTVLLREHDITIPKIVNQKIAEEISINIDMNLKKSKR